jgi:V/A-type H+-transporting ATPase subunit E
MQDKLQELTDRLYNEGLAKGKEEGERLLAEARRQAAAIREEAEKEAGQIRADAQKEADDLRAKVEADLKMAASQCLQATKNDLENLLGAVSTADKLSDPDFLKELILAVAKGFDASGAEDLEIVLPESMKGSLESWASSELTSKLKAGVSASFSKKVAGGFTVAPRDGGWYVSFTDESFDALIREYLRPVTRKLIFGK